MKVNIIEEVGRSSGKYLASHCQRKAVIQRWINVLFQEVKVLSKHTLATPSYISRTRWVWNIARYFFTNCAIIFHLLRDILILSRDKIKGLLEPAHSCYGLSLHWFLGLAEYWYSWIRFMWTLKPFRIHFLSFLGSCMIRKLVHSS